MARQAERMTQRRAALVTGGATGIGRACAMAFAAADMDVAVADLNLESAVETCRALENSGVCSTAILCDVRNDSSVREAVEKTETAFGRLDVLVTAAGIDLHKPLVETSSQEWTRVIEVNLGGSFLAIKYAAPIMAKSGYGRVICIGSTAGILGMGFAAYSASKAGLLGLVRSAVREFSASGITLNVVAPGPTETPMTDVLWQATPGRRERLAGAVPVGRVARPAEIADTVVFVASEKGSFINGAEIVVDGGVTAVVQLNSK